MENNPLLKVQNLSLSIEGHEIFHNVSFEIHPEEVLAIIGPNGAGKSLLLKTLLGFFTASHGSIEWGKNAKIGYLPQRFHVDHYLPMTVKEFLSLKPHASYSLHELTELVKLAPQLLKTPLGLLSSGQLQKVLLAWAIFDKPNLLFFDEPTENVDVIGQESIYQLLHHLQDTMRISVIIISHDLHVVYRYADHVLCLNKHMLCYGEPHEALTNETLSKLYGDHAFFHHHHYEHTEHQP